MWGLCEAQLLRDSVSLCKLGIGVPITCWCESEPAALRALGVAGITRRDLGRGRDWTATTGTRGDPRLGAGLVGPARAPPTASASAARSLQPPLRARQQRARRRCSLRPAPRPTARKAPARSESRPARELERGHARPRPGLGLNRVRQERDHSTGRGRGGQRSAARAHAARLQFRLPPGD